MAWSCSFIKNKPATIHCIHWISQILLSIYFELVASRMINLEVDNDGE